MTTSQAAIIEFGSYSVNVIIGERGVNNTLKIKGRGECEYGGYYKGVFRDADKIGFAIAHALKTAETACGIKIKKLYVGVPTDFSVNITREVGISFQRKQRIRQAEIDDLFARGNNFGDVGEYIITDMQPIYFSLDDERRLLQPEGYFTTQFGGFLSYVLASESFYAPLVEVFRELEIEAQYISAALAKLLYLFPESKRESTYVFVDVGMLSTSVVVAKGNGILSLYNFALGGASITEELSQYFEISSQIAETLKRKVILTLLHEEKASYDIECKDEILAFPAQTVDEIVSDRLSAIGHMITKCLNACEFEYPDYAKFYLSGGGVAYIKGAKSKLSRQIGKQLELVSPRQPQMDKPHLAGGISLLEAALKREEKEKPKSFFARLRGF